MGKEHLKASIVGITLIILIVSIILFYVNLKETEEEAVVAQEVPKIETESQITITVDPGTKTGEEVIEILTLDVYKRPPLVFEDAHIEGALEDNELYVIEVTPKLEEGVCSKESYSIEGGLTMNEEIEPTIYSKTIDPKSIYELIPVCRGTLEIGKYVKLVKHGGIEM